LAYEQTSLDAISGGGDSVLTDFHLLMDKIEFVVLDNGVDIFINGRNLIDMVREVELPFAQAEGHPFIAGGYMGLPIDVALWPSRQLLGEPLELYQGANDKTVLMVCGSCGFSDCWPLQAKVAVLEDEIVWSDFRQPYRQKGSASGEWRYDNFGPFRFDKQQYLEALGSPSL
jgi:hypothetical protein